MNKRVLVLALLLLLLAIPAAAQTNTPIPPTATPAPPTAVSLSVDTNVLFNQANSWIASFLPIFAVGIGLSVALAILTYVGARIVGALQMNDSGASTMRRKSRKK